MEKVYDSVLACSSLEGIISDMQVIEDFESRPHKAVTFIVERGKERQEWNDQKMPMASSGQSGGRLPGRCVEEKGRETEEECAKSRQGQEKHEKIEEGIRSSQRMAFEGPNAIQRWDSSQIENQEERRQEGDQVAEQWEEEQQPEDIIERRRMEGSSFKLDVIQKST